MEVLGDGVTASFSVVSDSDAFQVRKLEIHSGNASQFHIQIAGIDPHESEPLRLDYRVDPAWHAPGSKGEVRVLDAERQKYNWLCSHKDVLSFEPSVDAPLYRFEWADTAAQYASGDRQIAYFPHHPGMFWFSKADDGARVEVGHANCFGDNLPSGNHRRVRPDNLRFIGVAAIFPDGTIRPASSTPLDATTVPATEQEDPLEPVPWEKQVSRKVRKVLSRQSRTGELLPAAIFPLSAAFVLGFVWPKRRKRTTPEG